MAFHVPERLRVTHGALKSDASYGNNGAFTVTLKRGQTVNVVASDYFWEHVSVSRTDRCPSWEEMTQIKQMFWDAEDCVVQFHPPESEYVNNHQFTLHLWRQIGKEFPRPPAILVGIK